jgi:signal transduction histidine kinase
MAQRMRVFDWSGSDLGPPEDWPDALKISVRIILTSRHPMFVWWGDNLINLYNDGYADFLLSKHPSALGKPASAVWPEIWHDVIVPRIDFAKHQDSGTYDEAMAFVMLRRGYPEETYATFSYSPILDNGRFGGILCPVTEDTERIRGQRQMALLRELAAKTLDARNRKEACALVANALQTNTDDLPFALIYELNLKARVATLEAAIGVSPESPAAPKILTLGSDSPWPLRDVSAKTGSMAVSELRGLSEHLPKVRRQYPITRAVVLPLTHSAEDRKGTLVIGLNPLRPLDENYREFLHLVSAGVSSAMQNADAYEAERRRAEALAELDRAKTAFFSNVSHEFRTPLTLILSPLEDALAEAKERSQRERLELLHRNALRLQKLVNTLLDFSRIEAGRIEASYEPTELAELTAELASVFRSAIEKAGMRLVVHCPPLAEPVYVDRDMYEKIVLNLLSNAFKFTLEGGIEVTLQDAGAMVELSVTDTGTGIAEEQLPHIFERFHRIEGVRARTHEGTGIGLALVQELVKLHGGLVDVRSVAGRGSTFTVRIPKGKAHLPVDRIGAARRLAPTALAAGHYLEEALRWLPEGIVAPTLSDPPPMANPPRAGTAEGPRPRIVWADDNADMRDYVSRLLSPLYEVEAVPDGESVLAAVRRRLPELILADVMMPRLDGLGLLRALRADEQARSVPVVLLSARAGEESRVEGMEAGADDYLVKPFSARELVARVDAHLKMARLRAEGEKALRKSEQRQAMLAAELRHRVRNLIAIISTISARTARSAESVEDYAERMGGRLMALSRTQALLTRDGNAGVDVSNIVRDEMSAQARAGDYEIDGPEVVISPKAAEVLGLAVHELATNSLKYGALSEAGGRVSASWRVVPRNGESCLSFDWSERRAHPLQKPAPSRRGFGTELIERRIPYELGGVGHLTIDGSGAHCHIEFPLRSGASILETDAPVD